MSVTRGAGRPSGAARQAPTPASTGPRTQDVDSTRPAPAPPTPQPAAGAPSGHVPGRPPAAPSTLSSRLRAPLLTAAAVGAATVVVALVDPHRPGSYGVCPSLWLTGLACPGCGALRATHDLAHGDLAAAWAMNPLWVLAVPVVVALWVAWVRRAVTGAAPRPVPRWLAAAAVVLVMAFAVLRNVPALEQVLGPVSGR